MMLMTEAPTDLLADPGPGYGAELEWEEFDRVAALPGYSMDIARVTYVDDGRRAFAELAETVTINGAPTVTPEVLTFAIDDDGLISQVTIYTRREVPAQVSDI